MPFIDGTYDTQMTWVQQTHPMGIAGAWILRTKGNVSDTIRQDMFPTLMYLCIIGCTMLSIQIRKKLYF